jgi:uncharacterized protein YbjT (DUF2867 family)
MILITGASGNIGTELVKRLTAEKVRFRAAVRERADKIAGAADVVRVDYARPETLRAALDGIDTLFLLVPFAPSLAEFDAMAVEEAKKAGVKTIVKSSVIGAAREAHAIARWHRQGEKAVEASGIAHTFLRPNLFMQSTQGFFAPSIKAQGAFYVPARDAKVSHVDVRDVAAVAARVLTESGHAGKAYEITGPEAITYADVAARLGKAIDKKVTYVDVPPVQFRASMLAAGAPQWMVDTMLDMERHIVEGGCAEVTDVVERVGRVTPTRFEGFASDFASSFR